jgi:hypothetical protein
VQLKGKLKDAGFENETWGVLNVIRVYQNVMVMVFVLLTRERCRA